MLFLPKATICVHCWGGFGSQLYALSVALDLKRRFKNRSLKIIFHTGGVTHRSPEILGLLGDLPFEIVEDFRIEKPVDAVMGFKKLKFRSNFARALLFVGLISRADSDHDFRKIKPWVRSLRGHYSYRSQSPETIVQIFSGVLQCRKFESNFLGIQYRLGDLTQLDSKSPIGVTQIAKVFRKIDDTIHEVKIYSDSSKEAIIRLSSQGIVGRGMEVDSLETVLDLSTAKHFIGTSSKISFWVVILRSVRGNSTGVYMPASDQKQLSQNLNGADFDAINFY